jgi:hypothetical protein
MARVNAVRNPDGMWVNSQVFREEALHYKKYGYYCADPSGSPDWVTYWTEQRRRCIQGYTVGGVKITGDHYNYLNFCPILKTEDTKSKKSRKINDFPDFWDGDYNYFWSREIARHGILDVGILSNQELESYYKAPTEEQAKYLALYFKKLNLAVEVKPDYLLGGWNIIVGKARRKGFSYKNASVAVNNYNCRPESLTIFGAYEKKFLYPKGIFTMANKYVNFLSENTAWVMPRDVINQPGKGHIKASYIEYQQGVPVEKGFKSEIMSISFKDDPDSARGKDAYDFIIEESGAFGTPGLLQNTLVAINDVVMDGDIKTGLITVFGTSGDMEGGTADYAEMFEKPASFGFMPFQNIWDEDSEDFECGFFHPYQWNLPGYYDEQGNSQIEAAISVEKKQRQYLLDKGATSAAIQKRMQEKPLGPKEAFGAVTLNNFPVLELKRQLEIVKAKNLHKVMGTPVELTYDYEAKRVKVKAILSGMANVIYRRKPDNLTLEGCPILYEYPCENPPKNVYRIGYDPYRQQFGSSLSAIYVYKPVIQGEATKNIIVAEYVGRPYDPDDVNYIASLFAMLYNTEVMYENEVTHVKDWFRKTKKLHLLAAQPDNVISANIKNSTVARVYGCHMNDKLKDAGEKYIKQWLTLVQDYDEFGNPIRTIDRIYSMGLLEELIAFNRKENFDRIMALMQVMFQDAESEMTKEHTRTSSGADKLKKFSEMMHNTGNVNKSRFRAFK